MGNVMNDVIIDLEEVRGFGSEIATVLSVIRKYSELSFLQGTNGWFIVDEEILAKLLGLNVGQIAVLISKLTKKKVLDYNLGRYKLAYRNVDYAKVEAFGKKYRIDKYLINLGNADAMLLHSNYVQELLLVADKYDKQLKDLHGNIEVYTSRVSAHRDSEKVGETVSPGEILLKKSASNVFTELAAVIKPSKFDLQKALKADKKFELLSGDNLEAYLTMKKSELKEQFDLSMSRKVLEIVKKINRLHYVFVPMLPRQLKYVDYINLLHKGWSELEILQYLDKLEDYLGGNPSKIGGVKGYKSVYLTIQNWRERSLKTLRDNSLPTAVAYNLAKARSLDDIGKSGENNERY